MKLRAQIEDKYKWQIPFSSDEEINSAFEDIKYLTETLPKYDGKLSNPDIFFEYFNGYKEYYKNIARAEFYIFNSLYVDNSDVRILKFNEQFNILNNKLDKATSFATPQIEALPSEYLLKLLSDPRAKNLQNNIKDIIRNQAHKIDENTSKVLSMVNNSFDKSESVYNIIVNSEIEFDDVVDSKGNKHKVDDSQYSKLVTSTDRTLRKNAYLSYFRGYKKRNKTLSELYINFMKATDDDVQLRKFSNLLEKSLFEEKIPESVFYNNINIVNKNIPLLQEFISTLKKESGLKNYYLYDTFQRSKINKKYEIEESKKIAIEALSILGAEYIAKLKYKLSDNSIDFLPNQNKTSLAYCCPTYHSKTVVLLNWDYRYNSLSTLCHEMGHCINTEFYNQAQPEEMAHVNSFAAEIASTTNELLLIHHLMKTATPKEKKLLTKRILDLVRGAIFIPTLYTEFELFAHNTIENEQPISYKDLNTKYAELLKKYYGNSCRIPDEAQYTWSYVPHFYSPYYVFSYSTGLITAINIVSKIIEDPNYTKQYIKFLKNGTEKPAVEILKEIGIDLTTKEPFERAFEFIKEQLNIYKSIK